MTDGSPTEVRHEAVVAAPLEQAFATFTRRFGDVKPREHSLLGSPIAETVFDEHVGGHIYDRGRPRPDQRGRSDLPVRRTAALQG